mmetsp:Transcript_12464/g.34695  ORF Transcript_12464/g.34695 Transcript_12464/m.34695 type:complete len:224 (-) Transcript_12464:1964-2635(-)
MWTWDSPPLSGVITNWTWNFGGRQISNLPCSTSNCFQFPQESAAIFSVLHVLMLGVLAHGSPGPSEAILQKCSMPMEMEGQRPLYELPSASLNLTLGFTTTGKGLRTWQSTATVVPLVTYGTRTSSMATSPPEFAQTSKLASKPNSSFETAPSSKTTSHSKQGFITIRKAVTSLSCAWSPSLNRLRFTSFGFSMAILEFLLASSSPNMSRHSFATSRELIRLR